MAVSEQPIGTLIAKLNILRINDPENGLRLAKEAYQQTALKGNVMDQVQILICLGKIYSTLGKYDLGLQEFLKLEDLTGEDDDQAVRAEISIGIGYIYNQLGEYVLAQQNYYRAYQRAVGVDDSLAAKALNNLGVTYIDTGEYQLALEYLQKSLLLARSSQDVISLNAVLDSLADLYLNLNQLDLAIEFAKESIEIARGNDPDMGENIITLGKIYLAKAEYEKALEYFQEAATVGEQSKSLRTIILAWLMIGSIYRMSGKIDESLRVLETAYQLALSEEALLIQVDCVLELSRSYKEAGCFQKALEYFEQYHNLKERVFNERSDMRMKTLEVIHQLENVRQQAEILRNRTDELQREIEERAKIEKHLEELATRDSLTGIYNRRYFIQLSEILLRKASEKQPLSLILIDLDHFKEINDQYGHIAGDMVLKNMAMMVHDVLRKEDIVARLGGDEFAILLPDTCQQQAWQIAERLRVEISALPVTFDGREIYITMSLGVSESLPGELIIDGLLARSDKSL